MEFILSEIQSIRKSLGITQSQLADIAGVSQSLIAKIESDNIDPTFSNAKKIFAALVQLSKKTQKTIADIMNDNIIALRKNETIKEAIAKMKIHGISQMPVVDEKQSPIGIVSESSLLDALLDNASKDTSVFKIMMDCPPILTTSTPVEIAYQLLKHYPMIIVNEENMLRGIVTKSDILLKMYK